MRIANLAGRAVLLEGDRAIDIATVSDGRFGPEPLAVYRAWDDFVAWGTGRPGGGTAAHGDTYAQPGSYPCLGGETNDDAGRLLLLFPVGMGRVEGVFRRGPQTSEAAFRLHVRLPAPQPRPLTLAISRKEGKQGQSSPRNAAALPA